MKRRLPFHLLKWPAALAVCAGLFALAYLVHAGAREERERQSEADRAARPKREDNPGEITVKGKNDIYEVALARQIDGWTEPLTIYGRIVPHPRMTSEVRSPLAGTLRARQGQAGWPVPGQHVRRGEVLGWVDWRVEPQVRLELQNKLNEARQQLAGAAETHRIAAERAERFRSAPRGLSPREREEARVQLAEARTKEAVAREAVTLWTEALADIARSPRPDDSPWTQPLKAPADGEVIELLAQPGTAVEAGGVIARVVDFRRLLVRLDFPPEALAEKPPAVVHVQAGHQPPPALRGARNQPLPPTSVVPMPATLVGPAPQLAPASQYAGYFYEIATARSRLNWRPGLFVRVELHRPARADAPPRTVVVVPGSALLYHQGRALVYVRTSKDRQTATFKRCQVQVLGREGDRWVLAESQDVVGGVAVVVGNAQVLLSEEFNADTDD
jgi:biotin carboxyl carrier protein